MNTRTVPYWLLVATALFTLACGGGDADKTAPEPIAEATEATDEAQAGEAPVDAPTATRSTAEAEPAAAAEAAGIDPETLEQQGTLTLKEYSVAFIGSADMGKGTLHVGDQSRNFRIGGLGIGGIGVAAIDATGNVYHLEDVEAFPGVYGKARIGAAAADKGKGRLWLKNPKGVVIELYTEMEGLALTAGVDGIVIEWESDYQAGLQKVKDAPKKAWDATKDGSRKAWEATKEGADKAVDAVKEPFE